MSRNRGDCPSGVPVVRHVLVMPYMGVTACQLDREFVVWLLGHFPRWRPNLAGACPICRGIVEESAT